MRISSSLICLLSSSAPNFGSSVRVARSDVMQKLGGNRRRRQRGNGGNAGPKPSPIPGGKPSPIPGGKPSPPTPGAKPSPIPGGKPSPFPGGKPSPSPGGMPSPIPGGKPSPQPKPQPPPLGGGLLECLDGSQDCCAAGYEYKHGDIPGWGQLATKEFGYDVSSCDECARTCTDIAGGWCNSYECSPTKLKCNYNMMGDITAPPYEDFRFCKKIVVPDPNQPGWFDNRNDLLSGDWSELANTKLKGMAYVTFGIWSAGSCGSNNGEKATRCIKQLCKRHPGFLCSRYLDEGDRPINSTQGAHIGGIACGQAGRWGGCAFWEIRIPPNLR